MVRRGEKRDRRAQYCVIGKDADAGGEYWLSCEACQRSVRVFAADLIEKHGIPPTATVYDVVQRMRCAVCGSPEVCLLIAADTIWHGSDKATRLAASKKRE